MGEMKNKNLGCMNGWAKDPIEYTEHLEKCADKTKKWDTYPIVKTNLGRCYNGYRCEKCGCSWTVDSSD